MAPSYQRQINDFIHNKDARTMHRAIRFFFDNETRDLSTLTKKEFIALMRKLQKAHNKNKEAIHGRIKAPESSRAR